MLTRCDNCFFWYEDEFEICPSCGYVSGAPAGEVYHLYPGMTLNDRYIVGQVLGFGGFGIIYKVWDSRFDTIMAIKEYYPSGLVNRVPGTKAVNLFAKNRRKEFDHGLTRFLDEARNMAKFNSHKSIVNVFEYFEENDTAYIVMEYLEGMTLGEYLKETPLGYKAGISLILKVCSALKDIHATGIVHRDVSPDNIFICTNNNIKLIDFGAARFSSDEEKHMTIILKPGFAPPEQYEKVNIQGPWTDIYALGATFYFAVTGIKPEESTNRKTADDLIPPIQLDSKIPEYISDTIMKAMAVDRHLRFSSVTDFEKALNREKKVLPLAKEKKRRKVRRLATALSSTLIIVIVAAIFTTVLMQRTTISMWYMLSGNDDEDRAKSDAIEVIVAAFHESYPNVTIEVEAFSRDGYAQALRAAIDKGAAPTLFESGGLEFDISDNVIDLGDVAASLDGDQCYFIDKYETWFPTKKQLPLGFAAPVVFLNTTLHVFDGAGLKDIGDLYDLTSSERHVLVFNEADAPSFSGAYGGVSVTTTENAADMFLSGQAFAYFSDTTEYFVVQNALPGRYKLLYIDKDRVLCEFRDLWSVGTCDGYKREVAERLLLFMLSDFSQDNLYIQNHSGALPVNRNALGAICSVYKELEDFLSNMEDYYFEIQEVK